MFSVRFIVALFCFKYALCLQRQLCDTTDDECFINAVISRVYPRLIAGVPGVEASDPLHVDAIIVDLTTVRYELFNATLSGLRQCEFVKLDNKRVSGYTLFDYALSCPILTLQAQYELNGIIDSVPVEGKGDCQIVYEDYHISISGKHEKLKDDKGKHHVNILNYSVITDLKNGKVRDPVYSNLVFSNHDSCINRVGILEEMTRNIVMEVFIKKLIKNLKNFLHQVPTEDLHYKYVR